ncbi:MAG: xylose isomerase [Gammaproteobacteria bacterium]|nr:xylose isomerase [Gammaproteobacteria bacterium]
MSFFKDIDTIAYRGPDSTDPLAFRYYDADAPVLGKTMAEHLRFAVCYWHSFDAQGADVFGVGTWDRPWANGASDPMAAARTKLSAAFEFFEKLTVPYYCFHDRDVAPEGQTFTESEKNLYAIGEDMAGAMEKTGVKLLWGTANLFGHPRYAAGAATNPNPDVFAHAAAQVKNVLELTHALGGENYVLWGGREGYDTLLNTDLKRESDQLGRFMQLVVEHKHKIGFEGTLLIEPKPCEPTKHQYDYDSAACYAFLQKYDLADEFKLNIECNHATLAGHTFQHEVAYAIAHGIFGSVDANRGDAQNGWDTDQYPNNVEESTLVLYEILKAGGLGTGGFNFDAKMRRQSVARDDLFYGHIGGMDTLARGLLNAAELLGSGELSERVAARYAGWDHGVGKRILDGGEDLDSLCAYTQDASPDLTPVSGRQELLENIVSRFAR